MPSFSIIIPTCGRSTITATLASLSRQVQEGDEVIVVGDGDQPTAAKAFCGSGLPGWYLWTRHASNDWGSSQRNYGMERARGDYLLFIDDDDVFLPGALSAFCAVLIKQPDHIPVFRMQTPDGRLIWDKTTLTVGNVGTAIFAVPNQRQQLPSWGTRYEADFDFLEACSKLWPIDWHEEIVCWIRPHEIIPKKMVVS